jgi:hypothetical protein
LIGGKGDIQDIRQIGLLGTDAEIVEDDISLFVFEWCSTGLCFLGFFDIGKDFGVHFTNRFTLLCTNNTLTKIRIFV